jgi:putative transposase
LNLYEAFPEKMLSRITSLRISRDGSKQYFAVFTLDDVRRKESKKSEPPKIIAFDPNHKNLVYGVDTNGVAIEVQNLAHLKKMDARIDQLKSHRDKCVRKSVKINRPDGTFVWKASNRWTFFNNLLDEAYRIRREQTKTFAYTLSNQICKQYDIICIGDYTPQGGGITTSMRRSMNNQSIIGRFKKTLEWVAFRSNRLFFEYNEKGTTRTCCECHHVVEGGNPPEVREWDCPQCGFHHLRDENAAINGLVKSVEEKLLLPRSGHRCKPLVTERRIWWVSPSGVQSALRGCDGLALPNTTKKLKRWGATPAISHD